MNDLHKAIGDLGSIRRQIARSTEFRGYGPVTLALTGGLSIVAAGLQAALMTDPARHLVRYLGIWISLAVVCAALTAVQTYTRSRRLHSGMSEEMIRMAVEQFMPAVGTGILILAVFLIYIPQSVWMLPGLWQVIFSLGVFSSCRFLPRPMLLAGGWYLLTGLFCFAIGDNRALSPWFMGIPFGVGQFLVAGILFYANHREEYDA